MSLEEYKCAFNNLHFCDKTTKKLSCGHFICKNCIPPSWLAHDAKLICKICNETNLFDLDQVIEINNLCVSSDCVINRKNTLDNVCFRMNGIPQFIIFKYLNLKLLI